MKLLFLAPSKLSRGDAAIAADLARQLPRKRVQVGFVSAAESIPQLHDLGMPALPLNGETPQQNLAILDQSVRGFRPDLLIAADAFAVDQSTSWSGISFDLLAERYDCPVGSVDRPGWQAAGYTADFYGGAQVKLPQLLDNCDLVIQSCAPHAPVRPAALGGPPVLQLAMHAGGLRDGGLRPVAVDDARQNDPSKPPVVFIANSPWEYRNSRRSLAVARLIDALPKVLHHHLAALGRPLQVVHVGPRAWRFPLAEQIEYRHLNRMPYPMFHARLSSADLFLTTNLLASTLGRAVLAGTPSLVLQNSSVLDQPESWLRDAAPTLGTGHPFRVAPLGWYEALEPLLSDNPYRDCFATAEVFDAGSVAEQLSALLDDGPARVGLREAQQHYRQQLAGLPQPLELLREVLPR